MYRPIFVHGSVFVPVSDVGQRRSIFFCVTSLETDANGQAAQLVELLHELLPCGIELQIERQFFAHDAPLICEY